MGFEPMNTGFADQRVSHFAIGALGPPRLHQHTQRRNLNPETTSVAPPSADTASPSCNQETLYQLPHSSPRR